MGDLTLSLKLLISTLIVNMLMPSCEKPSMNLPGKTHEGKNTYGYKFVHSGNEEIFTGHTNPLDNITKDSFDNLYINFSNTTQGLYYDKNYDLTIKLNNHFEFYNSSFDGYYNHFSLDSTQLNFCEITYLDSNKRIVSGFFEFNLVYSDSTFSSTDTLWSQYDRDSIQIKSGRFDLQY